jgi:lipid A ethanolaminephosphotransferase
MGSHGPRYYKRFPEKFAKFKPFCNNDTPQNCSKDDLNNAFDNTIFYTDYVLSRLIEILEEKKDYNTFLLYASDHGESLGENGIYLHGLPKTIAPKEQRNFAMILWLSDQIVKNKNINVTKTKSLLSKQIFPDMALSMLSIGEETGEMDAMLSKVADFYEEEVSLIVKNLTAMLEPAMIVVVGGIVASILVAMYLPMFGVFQNIN